MCKPSSARSQLNRLEQQELECTTWLPDVKTPDNFFSLLISGENQKPPSCRLDVLNFIDWNLDAWHSDSGPALSIGYVPGLGMQGWTTRHSKGSLRLAKLSTQCSTVKFWRFWAPFFWPLSPNLGPWFVCSSIHQSVDALDFDIPSSSWPNSRGCWGTKLLSRHFRLRFLRLA